MVAFVFDAARFFSPFLWARHNNDLYVFCHYKATRKDQNILDMDLWDFYVYPTFKIESDPRLEKKNSVSLYRLKKLGVMPVSFDQLYDEIISKIQTVSEYLSQSKKSVWARTEEEYNESTPSSPGSAVTYNSFRSPGQNALDFLLPADNAYNNKSSPTIGLSVNLPMYG